MRRIALGFVVLTAFVVPAFAQKVEIEAVNAKWSEFFSKGDFAGVASLYTDDAIAFPPGSPMVRGKAAIEAMWKGLAQQVSEPKVTTIEVKRLGPYAAREIGTFSLKTKRQSPKNSQANMSSSGKGFADAGNCQRISGTTANRGG